MKTLDHVVLDALEDLKAIDITRLDVKGQTSITDTLFICSGTSDRHLKAVANNVIVEVKKHGFAVLGQETDGGWVLIDLGDVVAHIMLPETRTFYSLEKLWSSTEQSREKNK